MPSNAGKVTISEEAISRMVAMCENARPEQWTIGLIWYRLHGKAIIREGAKVGLSPEQSCAIFACLSPQTRIRLNWEHYQAVLRDGHARGFTYATDVMRNKVEGCIAGTMPLEKVIAGDKVTAFYHNLMGDESWVTVDTHAADCVDGCKRKRPTLKGARYEQYAAHFRVVAAALNVSNAAAQAMCWAIWREQMGIVDDAGMDLVS